jgi:hypothetical protein
MIEDERPIHEGMLRTLLTASSRWQQFSSDYDREQAASRKERHTITEATA